MLSPVGCCYVACAGFRHFFLSYVINNMKIFKNVPHKSNQNVAVISANVNVTSKTAAVSSTATKTLVYDYDYDYFQPCKGTVRPSFFFCYPECLLPLQIILL